MDKILRDIDNSCPCKFGSPELFGVVVIIVGNAESLNLMSIAISSCKVLIPSFDLDPELPQMLESLCEDIVGGVSGRLI